jgi:hypothetical protein
MQSVLLVAATLACPVGMGLMMWMMMRGHGGNHQSASPVNEQIDELRAEIERLKSEGATDSRSGACDAGMAPHAKPRGHGTWRRTAR